MVAKDLSREELQEIALADEKVKAEIDGKGNRESDCRLISL